MRPTLDATMLSMALVLSHRATCQKLSVGCVLTDVDGVIVGTGYNGVPRGRQHCMDVPCPGVGSAKGADLCEAVHAEMNALLSPAAHKAYHCYVTHAPCSRCLKVLLNTSIQHIVFLNGEALEDSAKRLWMEAGREWYQHPPLI